MLYQIGCRCLRGRTNNHTAGGKKKPESVFFYQSDKDLMPVFQFEYSFHNVLKMVVPPFQEIIQLYNNFFPGQHF
jgi:hypothetical protein